MDRDLIDKALSQDPNVSIEGLIEIIEYYLILRGLTDQSEEARRP